MSIIAFYKYQTGFIKDMFFSTFIITLAYILFNKLKLNNLTFFLTCFSIMIHNLGAFGLYSTGFLGIPYDYITHFIGLFTATLIIANLLFGYLGKDTPSKKLPFFLIIFIAGLGVGSIIETIEFSGYLTWGIGEGFFQFGAGDYGGLEDLNNMQTIVGGGYFDTMEDLIVNSIGSLLATTFFALIYYRKNKHKPKNRNL